MAKETNSDIQSNSPLGAELEADEIKALASVISIKRLKENDMTGIYLKSDF